MATGTKTNTSIVTAQHAPHNALITFFVDASSVSTPSSSCGTPLLRCTRSTEMSASVCTKTPWKSYHRNQLSLLRRILHCTAAVARGRTRPWWSPSPTIVHLEPLRVVTIVHIHSYAHAAACGEHTVPRKHGPQKDMIDGGVIRFLLLKVFVDKHVPCRRGTSLSALASSRNLRTTNIDLLVNE